MAESDTPTRVGRIDWRGDRLVLIAGGSLVLALACAAVPILVAGPASLAGLLLFMGLFGVACLGGMAFRQSAVSRDPPASPDRMLLALQEPAAVVGLDGRISASNLAWGALIGDERQLPRGPAVFAALNAARRGMTAIVDIKDDMRLQIHNYGSSEFLVRQVAQPSQSANPTEPAIDAAAAATQTARPRLDALSAGSPFAAVLLDGPEPMAAQIIEANDALEAIVGRFEAGTLFGDLFDPASRSDAIAHFQASPGRPCEMRMLADPNRIAQLYIARSEARLTGYLVDVTDVKSMERQLAQAGKMQAVGQLAAGIAHDFNNLISGINFQLDELQQRHPLGDPSYEGLTAIRQTAARAADLVRKLKTYSRQETVRRESLDLGEVISEFEVLLRRVLREDVKLTCDYGRDLPFVRADKGQLEMAVMNLAVNARDAIRTGGGTEVCIRTARLSDEQARLKGYGGENRGDVALIEVSDDGPGIPPGIIHKIFEPFFTTKPVGEGTGFGLATVYGIVKQSEGWIAVDSEPGQGAAFRIFLPVHIPSAVVPPPPVDAVKTRTVARDLSGAGRILFVEDEDSVRSVAARLLRMRGYDVIEAADGEEALALAEQHAGTINLLISDVVMPGLDGPGLLKAARVYLGDAPVMFISGYAEAEFSDLLEGETGVSFLPKPIDIKTLAERVKQQLQAA